MSKRNKRSYNEGVSKNERAYRELQNMRHRDVQKACVLRGMPFEDVINFSHHKLVSWFMDNYDNSQSPNLINEYDTWMDVQLSLKGYMEGDSLRHPALKFGNPGNIEDMEKLNKGPVPNKPPKINKPKSEMDPTLGVRKGTKKALTYQLTKDKKPIEEIITQVKEAFPEAEEKSIRIWHKRCLKEE